MYSLWTILQNNLFYVQTIITDLDATSLIFKIFSAFCPRTIRGIIRKLVINFKIPYNFQTSILLLTYLYLSRVHKTMRFIGGEFMYLIIRIFITFFRKKCVCLSFVNPHLLWILGRNWSTQCTDMYARFSPESRKRATFRKLFLRRYARERKWRRYLSFISTKQV